MRQFFLISLKVLRQSCPAACSQVAARVQGSSLFALDANNLEIWYSSYLTHTGPNSDDRCHVFVKVFPLKPNGLFGPLI